jgi:16S rRNA (guanine1207-N2)-methyltransferase
MAGLDRLREDIEFATDLRGREFKLRSTWGLFSPREVDLGTRMLIDRLEVKEDDDCLDLGCGYGAIGLALAALAPRGRTLLVDKDFVAVDYAQRNARANGLANVEVSLSNGFDAVEADRTFDVIGCNLPAKIGNELTSILVADALAHLNPGGALYLVTLSGMRRYVRRIVEEHFGNYEKLKQGAQHTVCRAVRAEDGPAVREADA